jgi:hypothetical protein
MTLFALSLFALFGLRQIFPSRCYQKHLPDFNYRGNGMVNLLPFGAEPPMNRVMFNRVSLNSKHPKTTSADTTTISPLVGGSAKMVRSSTEYRSGTHETSETIPAYFDQPVDAAWHFMPEV